MTKARDLGDNAQNTKPKVVNAKADLIVGTGSDAADRLAVGSNGDTLVADSSTSTGLRWQGDYSAGKNKIINGDFRINQRAFTSNTATNTFGFDRFKQFNSGGTFTTSPQTQTQIPNDDLYYRVIFNYTNKLYKITNLVNTIPIPEVNWYEYVNPKIV